MKRREFIALLLGGATTGWAYATQAQDATKPTVGFLTAFTPEAARSMLAAFNRGLADAGYIDGKNVQIEYRWASSYDELTALAADLVTRRAAVIVAQGNAAARSAIATTDTIPIVFHTADDPIVTGLVRGLNNGRGNVTGVSAMAGVLPTKRLEFLHQLKPDATTIGVLVNPANANADIDITNLQAAAQALGLQLLVFRTSRTFDFENVFATLVDRHAGGLLVDTDSFFTSRRDTLIALSERYKVATIYSSRDFTAEGGLISYGADRGETYRLVGNYAARILKGERPGDLPIQQPVKFELVINLKTAKALGLAVPEMLLSVADEVIE